MNGDMSGDKTGDLDDNLKPAANDVLAKGLQLKRKLDVPESNTLDDMKKKPRITRNVSTLIQVYDNSFYGGVCLIEKVVSNVFCQL
jgi:hypothetical protein